MKRNYNWLSWVLNKRMRKISFPVLLLFFVLPGQSLAQEKKSFKTEYERIMALKKKWEVAPDSIIKMKQRTWLRGRRIIVKTQFCLIEMRPYFRKPSPVPYESLRKIKYTRAGRRFEKLKVFQKVGPKHIATIKRMDDQYFMVYLRNNSNQETIVGGKYIIVYRHEGPKKTKEYYVGN